MSLVTNITKRFIDILNREYHQIILWKLVFLILGILAYFNLTQDLSWQLIILLNIFSLSSWFIITKKKADTSILWYCSKIIILFFILGFTVSKIRFSLLNTVILQKPLQTIVIGTITELKPAKKLLSVHIGEVYIPLLKEIPRKIHLNIPKHYLSKLQIGDVVFFQAKLQSPMRDILPGGYNFGISNYFNEIGATGRVIGKINIIAKKNAQGFNHKIQSLRKSLYIKLITYLEPDAANFAAAIMLGDSGGISNTAIQNMRRSGISHILCVSGLHLSLVALICFNISRFLLNCSDYLAFNYNTKNIAGIIAICGSLAYLYLSGMQIAATRAFLMVAITMIAILVERMPTPLRSINFIAVLTLIFNPEYVFFPSFQLSYLAVISLIISYEFFVKFQQKASTYLSTIQIHLLSNIYSTVVASIFTAPLVIYNFFSFANHSLPANLVAIPIMSFILMPLTILALLVMPFGLETFILKIIGLFTSFIIRFAAWIVSLPYATWYVGHISGQSLVLYLLGFFWLAFWQTRWRIIGVFVMLCSFIWMLSIPNPDLIIDGDKKIFGFKEQGKLKIHSYSPTKDSFLKSYWYSWFGQPEEALDLEPEAVPQNHKFVTESGAEIIVIFDRNQPIPDLNTSSIILNYDNLELPSKLPARILTSEMLKKQPTILISCKAPMQCIVQENTRTLLNR